MRPGQPVDVPAGDVERLVEFIDAQENLLVLTGAGVSTQSGIPAYRDGSGRWLQRRPILYQDFLRCEHTRRRYWARSFFGWPVMARASVNAAHEALAALEAVGRLGSLVTQNVDGLHRRAGQRRLIELHGRLDRVYCLGCGIIGSRAELQERLIDLNRDWTAEVRGINADGDARLDDDDWPGFRVADCPTCGGALKPQVVFFGETVPPATRRAVSEAVENASAVLVLGSSLVVGSAYRLVRDAAARGRPVVAVNQGRTRADELLTFKVDACCATAVTEAGARLQVPAA
ncbi:NAD-dependent protein deacetylase [Wenzhouxiangella sp. 15181]|nr:NAD-dependent protein deacetylase [Wenzhouxiangella sp. 15181]RFP67183.1 NAD-dependent protein deacetylase [Wenzhouxiangella sp. 15190]